MADKHPILGLDYGEKNIGLAFGVNGLVSPIEIIDGRNVQNALGELAKIVIKNDVSKIVVGLPLTATGKETKQSLRTRRFVNQLKLSLKTPVVYQEEYLSTYNATREALDWGVPQEKRRDVDHLAAAIILLQYFEDHQE